jgi:hypothetical protein
MTLFTVKDEHPAAVKAAIGEILPQWLDAFRQLLQVDVAGELQEGNWEGIAVRTAIFNVSQFSLASSNSELKLVCRQALEIILNSFPSTLKSSLPLFVSLSSSHLSSLLPIYDAAYLSNSSDFSIPSTASGDEDSDISMDLGTFVATILDFIAQAARRKTVRSLFAENNKATAGLVEFLKQAIEFSKMTTDDEDTWASDPNAFVADEDDEMVSQNVRSAALDMSIVSPSSILSGSPRCLTTRLFSGFRRNFQLEWTHCSSNRFRICRCSKRTTSISIERRLVERPRECSRRRRRYLGGSNRARSR